MKTKGVTATITKVKEGFGGDSYYVELSDEVMGNRRMRVDIGWGLLNAPSIRVWGLDTNKELLFGVEGPEAGELFKQWTQALGIEGAIATVDLPDKSYEGKGGQEEMISRGGVSVVTIATCGRCGKQQTRGGHNEKPPERWAEATLRLYPPAAHETTTSHWLLCWDCYIDVSRFLNEAPAMNAAARAGEKGVEEERDANKESL